MHHFQYRDGQLWAEDVPLASIAAKIGTPTYIYSRATLERHYRVYAEAFADNGLKAQIYYAVKANHNLAILKLLGGLGAGADILTEGEMLKAQMAGIPPSKMVFSGVGKSRAELERAIGSGIYQINLESLPEMHLVNQIAAEQGKIIDVGLRLNPDVAANTHAKITTGTKDNKFGLPMVGGLSYFQEIAKYSHLRAVAVAIHIGSQITDLKGFDAAFARLADFVKMALAAKIDLKRLDLGGGLGIPYHAETPPLPSAYATLVKQHLGEFNLPLMLEPGRLIVGNAGIMLTKVFFEKQTQHKRFVIIDAGMNDLIRPAMYGAWHEILPVTNPNPLPNLGPDPSWKNADVVGPICESSDIFAADRPLPSLASGDLLALMSAGAYGMVMGSTYNLRPLAAEVMVDGDKFALVRPRMSLEMLLSTDRLPDFLA